MKLMMFVIVVNIIEFDKVGFIFSLFKIIGINIFVSVVVIILNKMVR